MTDKLLKLLTVKSIVTLILTAVFAVLCVRGSIDSEQFLTVYTVIMSFYFGTQFEKHSGKNKEDAP